MTGDALRSVVRHRLNEEQRGDVSVNPPMSLKGAAGENIHGERRYFRVRTF